MTLLQKWIVVLGFCLFAAAGVYSPCGDDGSRLFLFGPHRFLTIAADPWRTVSVEYPVDVAQLGVEWLLIAGATATGVLLSRK